jgi:hypothetical protein
MITFAVLSLAGSLFSVATPTATYPHPAVHQSQPTQIAHLTRQWVADGRGQVWRPEVVPAKAQPTSTSTVQLPTARTFASVGR